MNTSAFKQSQDQQAVIRPSKIAFVFMIVNVHLRSPFLCLPAILAKVSILMAQFAKVGLVFHPWLSATSKNLKLQPWLFGATDFEFDLVASTLDVVAVW